MKNVSSTVIMAYFFEMEKKSYKPTSLWSYYSMLKGTIRIKENIDIGQFGDVVSFLKNKSSGFKSVKAEVFTEQELKTFFDTAGDLEWLDVKVIRIFGLCGACRTDEFLHITVKDVVQHSETLYLVTLTDTKTKIDRKFTITGGFLGTVKKYINLRPLNANRQGRFFVNYNYQRGKCTTQNIGRNKISAMPQRIAEFLVLPEAQRYKGHSFRRTSATILANSGADMETIMRHGGWKNDKSAKVYIEDSVEYKARTGNMITNSILGSSAIVVTSVVDSSCSSVDTSSSSLVAGHSMTVDAADSCESGDGAGLSSADLLFDTEITDSELIDIADRCSQAEFQRNLGSGGIEVERSGTQMVVTQALSTTTSVKVSQRANVSSEKSRKESVPDAFKQFHFEKMDNCTFNLYAAK